MNNDYSIETTNGISCVRTLLFPSGCAHGFTTRAGGVSEGCYSSLNLGWNRPEPRESIKENYLRLFHAIDRKYESAVLVSYEHGTKIYVASANDRGRGMDKEPLPPCDGIVTNSPDLTLITLHADCSGFFLYDPVTRSVGLAHAGWRGMLGRIGAGLVSALQNEYGARPSDIFACIVPGICRSCYEVDIELADRFRTEFSCNSIAHNDKKQGKAHLDLQLAGELQMREVGILPEHLSAIPCCTYENDSLFYSYRRDNGKTGAMASYIHLDSVEE